MISVGGREHCSKWRSFQYPLALWTNVAFWIFPANAEYLADANIAVAELPVIRSKQRSVFLVWPVYFDALEKQ